MHQNFFRQPTPEFAATIWALINSMTFLNQYFGLEELLLLLLRQYQHIYGEEKKQVGFIYMYLAKHQIRNAFWFVILFFFFPKNQFH